MSDKVRRKLGLYLLQQIGDKNVTALLLGGDKAAFVAGLKGKNRRFAETGRTFVMQMSSEVFGKMIGHGAEEIIYN